MHSPMLTSSPFVPTMQRYLPRLASVALCLFLTACGFHLKGISPLPFNTIYTNIEENSEFGSGLRRAIVASRSEEHTSELQSLMRISYAVFCLKKKKKRTNKQK